MKSKKSPPTVVFIHLFRDVGFYRMAISVKFLINGLNKQIDFLVAYMILSKLKGFYRLIIFVLVEKDSTSLYWVPSKTLQIVLFFFCECGCLFLVIVWETNLTQHFCRFKLYTKKFWVERQNKFTQNLRLRTNTCLCDFYHEPFASQGRNGLVYNLSILFSIKTQSENGCA